MDTGCRVYTEITIKRLKREDEEKKEIEWDANSMQESIGTADAICLFKMAIEGETVE